jgi:hypothetical protein
MSCGALLDVVDLAHAPEPAARRDAVVWLAGLAHGFSAQPQRFRHSRTVWRRARAVSSTRPAWMSSPALDTLALAGLLHDVGRLLDPDQHQPHALVRAAFLADPCLHDIAPLVAHHSGARLEAELLGITLPAVWEPEPRLLDVLTSLDRTTGPDGRVVSVAQRRAVLVGRFGAASLRVRRHDLSVPSALRGRVLLGSEPSLRPAPGRPGRGRRNEPSVRR